MDLNDTERYATAALFTLALHNTHIEVGVDRNGASLANTRVVWGCPSDEALDDLLFELTAAAAFSHQRPGGEQSPPQQRLPLQLQPWWGYDAAGHGGLCVRVYSYLGVPPKAWPGLMRLPDVPGAYGSSDGVEAFVQLVRRYSAFLDPHLDFTCGHAKQLEPPPPLTPTPAQQLGPSSAASEASPGGVPGASPGARSDGWSSGDDDDDALSTWSSCSAAGAGTGGAGVASTGVAGSGAGGGAGGREAGDAAGSGGAGSAGQAPTGGMPLVAAGGAAGVAAGLAGATVGQPQPQQELLAAEQPVQPQLEQQKQQPCQAASAGAESTPDLQAAQGVQSSTGAACAAVAAAAASTADAAGPSPLAGGAAADGAVAAAGAGVPPDAQGFEALRSGVDVLPRSAAEGTVMPNATFAPAAAYAHAATHKAVMAMYELIGGCLSNNTDALVAGMLSAALESAAQRGAETGSGSGGQDDAVPHASAGAGDPDRAGGSDQALGASRPQGAWFAAAPDSPVGQPRSPPPLVKRAQPLPAAALRKRTPPPSLLPGLQGEAGTGGAAQQQEPAVPPQPPQQSQQQQLAVASIKWYDARARVALKRVAHWLRVPWPQVLAFEQMWAQQALQLDVGTTPPQAGGGSSSSSSALWYLKVGAAAAVGGGLLALTGGLAAPAIAAGLGAAVTLAHGSAAAAAAVTGFAGSAAGTATLTSLFGAWGASAAGGSAGERFKGVSEFGFYDLSQSLYVEDAAAPTDAAAAPTAAAPAGGDGGLSAPLPSTSTGGGGSGGAADGGTSDGAEAAASGPGSAGGSRLFQRLFQRKAAAGAAAALAERPGSAASSSKLAAARSPEVAAGEGGGGGAGSAQGRRRMPKLLAAAFSADSDDEGGSSRPSGNRQEAGGGSVCGAAGAVGDTGTASLPGGGSPASGAAPGGGSPPPGARGSPRRVPSATHPLCDDYPHAQPPAGASTAVVHVPRAACTSDSDSETDDAGGGKVPAARGDACAPRGSGGSAAGGGSFDGGGGSPSKAAAAAAAAARARTPRAPLPIPINPRRRGDARMAVLIGINGSCSCLEDFAAPWRLLPGRDCDRFAVVWEQQCLRELNTALGAFIRQQAVQQVATKAIQTFFYTGLVAALALPMAITTTLRVTIGSKWAVALRRSQAAGKMLAAMLAQGYHGDRPVTLIGLSMGARVAFHCLLELSRMGALGLVENAVLLGTPVSCRPDRWAAARSAVAGRLINGYSVNDWTLGVVYRAHSSSSIWLAAAGLFQVGVPGVENVNLSRLVGSHVEYMSAMEDILDVINLTGL